MALGSVTKATATNETTTVSGEGVILYSWIEVRNGNGDFTIVVDGTTIYTGASSGIGAADVLTTTFGSGTGFTMTATSNPLLLYRLPISIPFKTSFSLTTTAALNTISANYVLNVPVAAKYLGTLTKISATNQTTSVVGSGKIKHIWSSTTNNDINTFTIIVDGVTIIDSINGAGAKLDLIQVADTDTGFYFADITAGVTPAELEYKTGFSIISLRAANTINANYMIYS